jgi:hypothetical protein
VKDKVKSVGSGIKGAASSVKNAAVKTKDNVKDAVSSDISDE